MNIIGRIASLLAAALVIVGIALGVSQISSVQAMTPTRAGFEQQVTSTAGSADTTQGNVSMATSAAQTLNPTNATGEARHEGGESGSLFGIVQVFMNFIIMSLIVLPFAVVPWFLNGRKPGPPGGPSLDQTTPA